MDAKRLFNDLDNKEKTDWLDMMFEEDRGRMTVSREDVEELILEMDIVEFQEVKKLNKFKAYKFLNNLKEDNYDKEQER